MHDIWNPWHGCKKVSEGCQNCYMYYLDEICSSKKGNDIYKVKNKFYYPLSKDRKGKYKIKSGETIRVCMTSDFFLEEADIWRNEVWKIIKKRSDVIFSLITKRPERIKENLPLDWNSGYENVFLHITCENQVRADERLPILLDLPFKHKGIMCAPFIGKVDISKYLKTGQIQEVICGGENYGGIRECNFDWVLSLSNQCKKYNIKFCFIETGTNFIKDNKQYIIRGKKLQSQMAYRANVNFKGKDIEFNLYDELGNKLKKENLYVPKYSENCIECGSKLICNGCSKCKKCSMKNS